MAVSWASSWPFKFLQSKNFPNLTPCGVNNPLIEFLSSLNKNVVWINISNPPIDHSPSNLPCFSNLSMYWLLDHMTSCKSYVREFSSGGSFTHTTSTETPQLRHRNLEHLLAIQMKIKNIQIFLGQKGQQLEATLDFHGETVKPNIFWRYSLAQVFAIPEWSSFRKHLLCFVKSATSGRICHLDLCQTMFFFEVLFLFQFYHHRVKLRPEKIPPKTNSDPR